MNLESNNFNDLYKEIIRSVIKDGKRIEPRGLLCYEISPFSFTLTDISRSMLTLKERNLSYRFNAAEKLCYILGLGGEDILPKYAPGIVKFINPKTGKFSGAYGPRLTNQYKYILDLLKKDPDTRQAVMNIYDHNVDHQPDIDIPCTCLLQFFIRDNKLNLVVYMRSNDNFLGTPYDTSQFTFIQECFARILGVENGTYTHIAGSMHIYQKDYEKFLNILKSEETVEEKQMPVDITTYEQLIGQATLALRKDSSDMTPYFNNLNQLLYG